MIGNGGGNAMPSGDVVLQVDGLTFAKIARSHLLTLQNVHGQRLGFRT